MRDSPRCQAPDRFGFLEVCGAVDQPLANRCEVSHRCELALTARYRSGGLRVRPGGPDGRGALPPPGEADRLRTGTEPRAFVRCTLRPLDVRTAPGRHEPLIQVLPGTPPHATSECRCGYGAVSRTLRHRGSGCRPSGFRARATPALRGARTRHAGHTCAPEPASNIGAITLVSTC